jgi:hypothetical protein
MGTKYLLYIFVIIFFLAGSLSTVFAQSNICTVMENQKGLLTVSCPGEGPKIINMGGSADIYKPGDSITITGSGQTKKDRDIRPQLP